MLSHIPFPMLPMPPSWFPGHMNQFKRMLPALLKQTDVVLELRDSRLPLTSINRTFEGEPKFPCIYNSRAGVCTPCVAIGCGLSYIIQQLWLFEGYISNVRSETPSTNLSIMQRMSGVRRFQYCSAALPLYPAVASQSVRPCRFYDRFRGRISKVS